MSKIKYIDRRFSLSSSRVINMANDIIADYLAQGFKLTLRQLFYQFVSRDVFPESWFDKDLNTFNSQKNYKKLGNVISDARLNGKIDWESIEDRTRNLKGNSHWGTPADIVRSAADSFALDKWKNQIHRLEVWIEKEALSGVIDGVCRELDVPYLSCKGYMSQSEMWSRAMDLKRYNQRYGQVPIVIHLGDYDPSGIDMTRDIRDRFKVFDQHEIEVRRIALNRDQIDKYNPPPNPAKTTDSRYQDYMANHGENSWELDALEPSVIVELVRHNITMLRNDENWDAMVIQENIGREKLENLAIEWEGEED